MLWPHAERGRSGATTVTSAIAPSARFRVSSPSAWMPSSLVIRIRTASPLVFQPLEGLLPARRLALHPGAAQHEEHPDDEGPAEVHVATPAGVDRGAADERRDGPAHPQQKA